MNPTPFRNQIPHLEVGPFLVDGESNLGGAFDFGNANLILDVIGEKSGRKQKE